VDDTYSERRLREEREARTVRLLQTYPSPMYRSLKPIAIMKRPPTNNNRRMVSRSNPDQFLITAFSNGMSPANVRGPNTPSASSNMPTTRYEVSTACQSTRLFRIRAFTHPIYQNGPATAIAQADDFAPSDRRLPRSRARKGF